MSHGELQPDHDQYLKNLGFSKWEYRLYKEKLLAGSQSHINSKDPPVVGIEPLYHGDQEEEGRMGTGGKREERKKRECQGLVIALQRNTALEQCSELSLKSPQSQHSPP